MLDLFETHPYLPFQTSNRKKCLDEFYSYKEYETSFKTLKTCFDGVNKILHKTYFEEYKFIGDKFELVDCRRFFFNLYIKTFILKKIQNKYPGQKIKIKVKKQELDHIILGKNLIPNRFSNHYAWLADKIGDPFQIQIDKNQVSLYEPNQSADLFIQKLFLYNPKILLSKIKNSVLNSKKRSIIQLNENEIVREINSELIFSGYKVINIMNIIRSIYETDTDKYIAEKISKNIFLILTNELKKAFNNMPKIFFESYCQISSKVIGYHVSHLNFIKGILRDKIYEIKKAYNTNIFFSNGLFSGIGTALCDSLLHNDFKIITAEHGIKFSRDAITSLISDETKTSTHILNYNKNTNKIYNSKLSKDYKTYIVGASKAEKKIRYPSLQRFVNKKIYKIRYPQIIYVSHNIELNSEKYFPFTKSNPCIYYDEKFLIKVFGMVNKNVIVKLYPTKQYLEEKIFFIKDQIKKYKNVRIFDRETDFRYLRTTADIIITQSSESTLAWCIGVEKPLIFLDSKYYEPLKDEETKKVFKKCFFYFNYDKRGWEKELIKFLNLPITTIMKLWDEKKIYRDEFDEKYFLSKKKNAGKIGSNLILSKKL